MVRGRTPEQPARPRRPAATTPEGRESQLINAAVDLVERKLLDGTASSQEIVHFLKLGSSRERLEQDKLRIEAELNLKRIESMASQDRMADLMSEALNAFRSYAGQDTPEEHFDD